MRLRKLQSLYARLSSQLASTQTLADFDKQTNDDDDFAPWLLPNATDNKAAPTASVMAVPAAAPSSSAVVVGGAKADEVPPLASMDLAASIASSIAMELRARQSSTPIVEP